MVAGDMVLVASEVTLHRCLGQMATVLNRRYLAEETQHYKMLARLWSTENSEPCTCFS